MSADTKRSLLRATACASLLLIETMLVQPSLAQFEGAIALRSAGFCTLLDNSSGMRTVDVYHAFNAGAIGARFKLVADPGVTMTYVSEVVHTSAAVGNTQSGITLCYGSCLVGDALLVSVTYMAFGTSENCSRIRVVPHPASQTVEALRCDDVPVGTYIADLYVQAVPGDCGCPPTHVFFGAPQMFGCGPVPVRPTTWGAIKALYVN